MLLASARLGKTQEEAVGLTLHSVFQAFSWVEFFTSALKPQNRDVDVENADKAHVNLVLVNKKVFDVM